MILLIPIHFCHVTYKVKMKGICEGSTLVGCSLSWLISFDTRVNHYMQDRKLFPQKIWKENGVHYAYMLTSFGLFWCLILPVATFTLLAELDLLHSFLHSFSFLLSLVNFASVLILFLFNNFSRQKSGARRTFSNLLFWS